MISALESFAIVCAGEGHTTLVFLSQNSFLCTLCSFPIHCRSRRVSIPVLSPHGCYTSLLVPTIFFYHLLSNGRAVPCCGLRQNHDSISSMRARNHPSSTWRTPSASNAPGRRVPCVARPITSRSADFEDKQGYSSAIGSYQNKLFLPSHKESNTISLAMLSVTTLINSDGSRN